MPDLKSEIDRALKVLKDGGTILYPTDTIWGIGCDATNSNAVDKIFRIKQRPDAKSMLVLLDDANRLPSYIEEVPDIAWELIDVSDTPLTLIYPGARNLASNLAGKDGSIGIRITKDPFCNQLIRQFRRPLVSTSANISGKTPPAIFDDIHPGIRKAVDHIVNWRKDELTPAVPSSIIKLEVDGRFTIIRK